MYGAIFGDIVGSVFEFNNIKTKDFPLLYKNSRATDDSYMTMAVAKALCECKNDYSDLGEKTISAMKEIGNKFPHSGYGMKFVLWLGSSNPKPYNSCGNGCAMRVSPVGLVANDLEECKMLSRLVTEVTHNHPEGIKGAEAVAVCIYLAKTGSTKDEIREYVNTHYYKLNFTVGEIRPNYKHTELAQESIPHAIECFLESTDFEDALRTAISIGGDSDTIACMTCAIAEAFYGLPQKKEVVECIRGYCPSEYFRYVEQLEEKYSKK